MALPLAPQLIVNSRMLYFCWVPEDPAAAAALLPEGLEPAENQAIFINQYVVDRDDQTSHFGAYSLTYAGLDLAGLDLEDGTPGRWWSHYLRLNSQNVGTASPSPPQGRPWVMAGRRVR